MQALFFPYVFYIMELFSTGLNLEIQTLWPQSFSAFQDVAKINVIKPKSKDDYLNSLLYFKQCKIDVLNFLVLYFSLLITHLHYLYTDLLYI